MALMAGLDIDDALAKRMRKLGIRDEDLDETFTRGTGAGGQKINKTSSTVVLRHLPTGTEIRCQKERSQTQNRYWARVELCDRLQTQKQEAKLAEQNEREKKRRQSRPRPRGLQEKILKTKRERSEVKRGRGRVRGGD
ncbi:MAG: peptide chain release factor-like protein [Verrucomicrobiaceae bacterium]|nr:peptide chain release factor-like protein [Verrucomicrobiaceae bacterium]